MDANELAAREWLEKAAVDRRMAELAMGDQPPLWDMVCFHSQQQAEKALKAVLTYHSRNVPRSHALEPLVRECEAYEPTLVSLRGDAARLSRYAVSPRYPGFLTTVSEVDADAAVAGARNIWDAVLAVLPEETHL